MAGKFVCCLAGLLLAALVSVPLYGESLEGSLVKKEGSVSRKTIGGKRCIELVDKVPVKLERNYYSSFSIKLDKPVDLTGKSLVFDAWSPEPPAGFYVRCYAPGAKKPCWSFLSWNRVLGLKPAEIRLTEGRSTWLTWEAGMVSGPANQVDRIEFIVGTGPGNAGSTQRLLISNPELLPALSEKEEKRLSPYSAPELGEVVELPAATELVKDGKAAFVLLHPDTPAGKSAANKIAGKIRQLTGAAVTARPGSADTVMPGVHTVMLGNLGNNPSMRVLYARRQTMVDDYYPGKGGHTVETIVEPFRRGADVIVLGASDDTGLEAAVDSFIKTLTGHVKGRSLSLPILFEADYRNQPREKMPKGDWESYRKKGLAEAQRRLDAGQHTSLGGYLSLIGSRYLVYRSPLDARLYAEVAKLYAESAKADPRKFGGAWGFDSDFPSYQALAGWDLVEHDPSLTAADRLATSNALLRWLHEAIFAEASGGVRLKSGPVSNHLTFCSLGSLMGALYFDKYYPRTVPQAKRWLTTVHHNFALQNTIAKCHDDSEGYMWLTWNHVITYSLAFPEYSFFKSKTAAKVMRYCGLTMDNLGAQSAYGDSSGWNPTSNHTVLEKYYAATRDPLVGYMLSLKRSGRPVSADFFTELPEKLPVPTTLDGIQFYPLELGFYRATVDNTAKQVPAGCFDKLAIREKMDKNALYLMVDGVNNGGHRHADGNSILRYTQFGRVWLGDTDYKKNQQKYHNSLLMLCDGESFQLPDLMKIQALRDTPEWGLVTVTAEKVGPAIWRRHYVWLKADQAWMLVDEFTPLRRGYFRLTQRWNALGEIEARPDGFELNQQGPAMRVQTTGDLPLTVTDNADLGAQWKAYQSAPPVVRVIDQKLERMLEPNVPVRIAAVWHGSADGKVAEWSLDRRPNGFLVSTGKHQYTIQFDASGNAGVKMVASRSVSPRKTAVEVKRTLPAAPARVAWTQNVKGDNEPAHLTRVVPLKNQATLAVGAAKGKAGRVLLLDAATGKEKAAFDVAGPVNDLVAVEINGRESLVLACRDGHVRAVSLKGEPIWDVKIEFYRLFPDLWKVRLADLDNDGQPEIIIGCDNWRTYAFDRNGKELWRYEVIHPVRALEIADIDGNGKPDVLVGTGYMWATVLNEKGEKSWGGRFGFGCRAINAVRNGKGRTCNVLIGIDSGLLTFHNDRGTELARFFTGDEIFMIEPAAEVNGSQDAFVASYNGFIYRFSADGKRLWSKALSAPALVVRGLPDGGCVAGAEDGTVYRFDKNGKCLSVNEFDGSITDLLPQNGAVRVVTSKGVAAAVAL